MLSTKQVSEVAGVPFTTLCNWIRRKAAVPKIPGAKGRGKGSHFTTMQSVGVVVAHKLLLTERGCNDDYVEKVYRAFDRCTEEELQEEFEKGHTHFAGVVSTETRYGPYRPILQPKMSGKKWCDWPDVKEAYEKVKSAVSK